MGKSKQWKLLFFPENVKVKYFTRLRLKLLILGEKTMFRNRYNRISFGPRHQTFNQDGIK